MFHSPSVQRVMAAYIQKSAATKISPEQFDKLKPGQRIWLGVATKWANAKGETEFEVGRKSYSKRHDVYSKVLYTVDNDGKPIKSGVAKWTLFKRDSGVSLGHGGMGTVIKSFRTASLDRHSLEDVITAMDSISKVGGAQERTAASEITMRQLIQADRDVKKLITSLRTILRSGDPISVWSGIHGNVLEYRPGANVQLSREHLEILSKNPRIRWISFDPKTISVGITGPWIDEDD